MKKKLVIFLALLIVVPVVIIYITIPEKIHVSQAQFLPIPSSTVVRCFNDPQKRKEWWPAGSQVDGDLVRYNGYTFTLATLSEANLQKIVIHTSDTDSVNSVISSNLLAHDSAFLYWECILYSDVSPINRVQQYQKAKKIKNSIDTILNAFSKYVSTQKNVYGLSIVRVTVVDSILITEKKIFSPYPDISGIYEIINSLKKYIQEQGAAETGNPMININKIDSNNFAFMAAIPINKEIKESNDKKIKRLLYGGNLLMTQIKGGNSSINNAFQKMDEYRNDYKLIAPAIPYQSLVTDRVKITDTTQWETRVCYPVY